MFFVLRKKTALLYITVTIVLLCFISVYARYSSKDFEIFDGATVLIDPGHGGIDGGAVGKNGTLEKDLNLTLSLELKDALSKEGYKVTLTRDKDLLTYENGSKNKKRADTKHRLTIASDMPEALFISIHMNYFEDSSAKGSQIFYSVKNPESKKFALILKDSLNKHADKKNTREIKEAYPNIYIMRNVKNPAVLLECGFISNREEEKLLNTKEYRAKIIEAICEAIKNYKTESIKI